MSSINSRSILFIVGGIMLADVAQAAVIEVPNVKIESIKAGFGTTIVIKVVDSTQLSTGCTATDQQKVFFRTSSTPETTQLLQAQAFYADAQGRNIDIFYDNTVCNSTGGREIESIRVRPAT